MPALTRTCMPKRLEWAFEIPIRCGWLTSILAVVGEYHPTLFVSFMLRAGTTIRFLLALNLQPVLGDSYAFGHIGSAPDHGKQKGQCKQ